MWPKITFKKVEEFPTVSVLDFTLGLFQCFWFSRRDLLEVIDEFNDDFQYLASTKGSSSALVGGRSCTYVVKCNSLELPPPPLFFLSFSPLILWCSLWKLWLKHFELLFCFLSPPPPVFFLLLFSGKLWRLIIIFIIINANNDRFAVYATGIFQYVIWCQFVADVKGNPGGVGGGGGFQSQLNIDGLTLSQL